MSRPDDFPHEMTSRAPADDDEARALDALLEGGPTAPGLEPVAALLADVARWAEAPPPVASAELARQLAGPPVVDLATRRRLSAARVGVTSLAATLVVLGTVGAAAAQGKLPARAQNAVAAAVEALTPFSVPRAERSAAGPAAPEAVPVSTAPTPTAAPAAAPTPGAAQAPVPAAGGTRTANQTGPARTAGGGGVHGVDDNAPAPEGPATTTDGPGQAAPDAPAPVEPSDGATSTPDTRPPSDDPSPTDVGTGDIATPAPEPVPASSSGSDASSGTDVADPADVSAG